MPDFESMTLDELITYKAERKAEITAARELARVANVSYNKRVAELHLEEATTQLKIAALRDGRSLIDQAKFWLIKEKATDPGHRVQAALWLTSQGIL